MPKRKAEAKARIDKSTRKILKDGDHLEDLVKHPGWDIAKRKLTEKILSVGNIMTISKSDSALEELAARQIAIETIFGWLNDIEGTVTQHKSHREQFSVLQREDYLIRLEKQD